MAKILSACGQHEIQYTTLRMNNYMYNCVYNITSMSFYTLCAIESVYYWLY